MTNDGPGSNTVDRGVGYRVRTARESLRWTQRELAERLHELGWTIDPTGITRIEAGERALRVNQLYLVAKALQTQPTNLLQDDEYEIRRTVDEMQLKIIRSRDQLAQAIARLTRLSALAGQPGGPETLARAGIDVASVSEMDQRLLDIVRDAASSPTNVIEVYRGGGQTADLARVCREALEIAVQNLVFEASEDDDGERQEEA